MEAEGSGYDLIYETLLTTGKCKPVVYEGEDYVEVTVYKKIVSKESSRICDFVSANYKISQKAYISLGIILQKKSVTTGELSRELQLIDGSRLRPYVESLIANNIILHKGSGRGTKYEINPEFVSSTKMQFPTTLKTIEPYRLKALILEDLKYHSNSLLSEMATRLPDVDFTELEKMVRTMAKDGEITPIGGRKYRRYKLNEDSFLEKSGRK